MKADIQKHSKYTDEPVPTVRVSGSSFDWEVLSFSDVGMKRIDGISEDRVPFVVDVGRDHTGKIALVSKITGGELIERPNGVSYHRKSLWVFKVTPEGVYRNDCGVWLGEIASERPHDCIALEE